MSSNRSPRSDLSGLWVEYVLILVLIVIVIAIVVSLLGPYISNEVTEFMNNLTSNVVE